MCSINHELELIYVPIPKNASSSMQKILQNFQFNSLPLIRTDFDEFCEFKNNIHSVNKRPYSIRSKGIFRYYETSFDVSSNVMDCSCQQWQTYDKMSFVRNPYDKFISAYWFFIERDMFVTQSLQHFIDSKDNCTDVVYSHSFITQYDHLISADGSMNVKYIGKVENLYEDIYESFLQRVNDKQLLFPIFIENICMEKTNMSSKKKYYEYYDENTLQWVNSYFQKDFETFGYKMCNTMEEMKEECEANFIDGDAFTKKKEEMIQKNKKRHFLNHVIGDE